MATVKVEITVDDERLKGLLCCGMEGGIGYWARIVGYVGRDKHEVEFPHLDLPFLEGGAVLLRDIEEDNAVEVVGPRDSNADRTLKLDRAALERGLQIMAEKFPRHFSNFIQGNADAETGDVFVQCCLLGDAVYG